jgi:hypothetical protein
MLKKLDMHPLGASYVHTQTRPHTDSSLSTGTVQLYQTSSQDLFYLPYNYFLCRLRNLSRFPLTRGD